ncbi:MAG: AMP-binding protein [Wenzhouxiangellaceae bacterium]
MPTAIQQQIIERARLSGDRPYLCQPIERQWRQWTWRQAYDEACRLAGSLERLGLQPGDRVAIISKNCAHWIIADIALLLSGLISVPIYPTASARTIGQLLDHSGSKACIIGKLEHPESQLAGIPDDLIRIAMPYPGNQTGQAWDELLAGAPAGFEPRAVSESDTATVLYTSGSTGEPKGAMHSYANFAFVGDSLAAALDIGGDERVLSYLPLSHCTERAYVEAGSFYSGMTLYFVESLETFMEDLAYARPTLFGSVPRLWKKFQLGVLEKVPGARLKRLLRLPLLRTLIRHRIKRSLGLDQARWYASGSAPIAPSLLEWWHDLGVTIREGWGMTETFAYGTQIGRDIRPQFGTISRALPGVELKTGVDDELLIRCPCLMQGYYGDEPLSLNSMDDGYFRTGDRAFIDDHGWVSITGRVKELFKTTKGKYIAPVPLESLLARNEMIELACVLGSGLDQPVALVQLADGLKQSPRQLRRDLVETLDAVNTKLEPHQRIARIIITGEPWTVDNEMLTPTLKIRRSAIERRYREVVREAGDRVSFPAASHAE